MKATNKIDVKVEFKFSAKPAKVYDAWLDPKLAQRWFGPGLGETRPVQMDSKVGGRFRIVQIRDGQSVGHSGKYITLDRPSHLAFTWATDDDEGNDFVNIYIGSNNGGSQVRLVHTIDAQWAELAERTKLAWLSMMEEMDKLISKS